MPALNRTGRHPNFGADGTGKGCYGRSIRAFAASRYASSIVAVESVSYRKEAGGVIPGTESDAQLRAEDAGMRCARIASQGVTADVAATIRVHHLVGHVKGELILTEAENCAHARQPLCGVLEIQRAAGFD